MHDGSRSTYMQTIVSHQFPEEENYWTTRFEKDWVKCILPYDKKNIRNVYVMDSYSFQITGDIYNKLMGLSNDSDYRLHMIMISILLVLIHKYTGDKDIIIGTPILRQDYDADFINSVLALRNDLHQEGMTFKDLLLQVRQTIVDANEHQNYPIERLLYQLGYEVSPETDFPLFDIAVSLENIHDKKYLRDIRYNILFSFDSRPSGVEGVVEYNSALWDRAFIEQIAAHYTRLLQVILADVNIPLTGIDLLSQREKDRLLSEFNSTEANYPKDKTIHRIFEEKAAQIPGNTALVEGNGQDTVTYEELNNRADRLARHLISRGIKQDVIVGIMLDHSIDLVVGLLAILKANGAYLPLDPAYPENRLRYMLEDSGIEIIITGNKPNWTNLRKEWVHPSDGDIEPSAGTSPIEVLVSRQGDLLYVIYTSGSTGKPKGVLVKHLGFVNLVHFHQKIFRQDYDSRMSLVASPSFDAMAFELWPCLLHGAALHIVERETRLDASKMMKWLIESRITISYQPTAIVSLLLAEEWPPGVSLRALIAAGDKLTRYPTSRHPFDLYNLYGPTEDTVWTTWTIVEKESSATKGKLPHIGKPIDNHRVYILGPQSDHQPIGVPGELCIAGDGLARGYLNRPELTAEKFISPRNLNYPASLRLIYRTGDRARRLPDGNIEFLGRIDHQIKIRGFRVEVGEIEKQLLAADEIKEAFVITGSHEDGDKFLCAYFTATARMVIQELRDTLSQTLPYYMIPAFFKQLDAIPLTPNGKIDKKALPAPEVETNDFFTPPRDKLEENLAEIWSEELHVEKDALDIDANFFELGGHSIKATQLIAKINKELAVIIPLVELFRMPTIRNLSEFIRGAKEKEHVPLEPAEEKQYYDLSPVQKRLYILQQLDRGSTTYNLPQILRFETEPEQEKITEACQELVNRHESLRSSFHMVGDRLVQRIEPWLDFYMEYLDAPGPEDIDKMRDTFIQPFDLAKAPLLRMGIVKQADDSYLLLADMHHIIADAISNIILVQDFMALYSKNQLPPLKLHYKDYSEWRNSLETRESIREQGEYWEREFDQAPAPLNLPTDFQRPPKQRFEGNLLSFEIDAKQTRILNTIARSQGSTLFMVLLAIYNIFLAKISYQDEIVVGTPVAGRRHTDLEKIIGMFVNTLPLRNRLPEDRPYTFFLKQVREKVLKALENQEHPFEDLVEKVELERDMSRNPLFDVMFAYQNMFTAPAGVSSPEGDELLLTPYPFKIKTSKFDLTLNAAEDEEKLLMSFEYSTQLFSEQKILRFIDYFLQITTVVTQDYDRKIAQIEMISEEEKRRLLIDFNDTDAEYPSHKTIMQLFTEQVQKKPDHIALVGTEDVNYRELHETSERVASVLRQKGAEPGAIVGILVERSIEMITGIMGILKSGAAYLPLSPSYPRERIDFIMQDSSAKELLTHELIVEAVKEKQLTPPVQCSQSHYPAYVIYTSGTTGKPKGVIIENRSLVNRLNWMQKKYPIDETDRILLKTSFTFDVSVWEIFWWSFTGAGGCLLASGGEKNPAVITCTIEQNNVTVIHFVPSMLSVFLDYIHRSGETKRLSGLKQVFTSGEALTVTQVKQFNQWIRKEHGTRLANLYGPTEATIDVSYFDCPESEEIDTIPIGKPIDNIQLYILDRNLSLQPVGVSGELFIAGTGVAKGYLNRPSLTSETFMRVDEYQSYIPTKPNVYYKTGDLARRESNGNIEFLGRIDHQIKIRGFRIEPAEIDNRVSNHPAVKEAITLPRTDETGDTYLCSYIIPDGALDIPPVREYLAAYLPDYMIPAYFVELTEFPVTANGKIDRKALPNPTKLRLNEPKPPVAPANAIEKKLVEICRQVLGRDHIGREDNFFFSGGDSIKAVQVISRMYSAGYKVDMDELFKHPVIMKLAPHVKRLKRVPDQSTVTGTVPLTPIQTEFFNRSHIVTHHFNQAVILHAPQGFDKNTIETVFQKIQQHHDALRTTFKKNPDSGEILQVVHGEEYPLSLEEYNLETRDTGQMEMAEKIDHIQASIDLETGPLMKLALFHLEDGDRLLIAVHHLVIDVVSWRILFEDIDTLYGQLEKGEKTTLPLKTDSYKLWAEKLSEYAKTKKLQEEHDYWSRLEAAAVPGIPMDFEVAENAVEDTRSITFALNREKTDQLLTRANEAFNTGINDLLLTALGISLNKVFKRNRVLLALEGHGRENIIEDIDVSRTVGWFTSLYPVLLEVSQPDDTGQRLKEIKESLRRIPNNGIGYGILKYHTGLKNNEPNPFENHPQISFNYLGQFDEDVKQMSYFEVAQETSGNTQAPGNRREYILDVVGMVTNNRLTMKVSYNEMHFKSETMAALVQHYESELTDIIAFCVAQRKIEPTPSDFTYKDLSLEELRRLTIEYPELEDIYTLTPMQEGMLYHALADETAHSYFEQIAYHIQGQLDIELVEKSLRQLVKRHDILRTAFVEKNVPRPVQVVLKEGKIDFNYRDIHQMGSASEIEKYFEEFKAKDREQSFELSKGAAMRVTVLRTAESEYEFTWSFHHILMDGWCIGILNSEFFQIYGGIQENKPHTLPPTMPYRTYIQWLEKQDRDKSAGYWRHYLETFDESTGIPQTASVKTRLSQPDYKNEKHAIELTVEKTSGLIKRAAANTVTLNTLVQATWGILLGRYNGTGDILFGTVVSGRPSELEGIESMVGLFINTIPVRIRFSENMTIKQLLREIQADAVAAEPYHHHPLAEIQSGSPLKQNLLDHIVLLENFPIAEQIEGYNGTSDNHDQPSIRLTDTEVFEQTNYDLNVIITGMDQLTVTFQYNGNVYESDYIKQVARHFMHLINQLNENEELEIRQLQLLTDEEKHQLMVVFNNSGVGYPADKTIVHLFEEQIEKTLDHIALVESGNGIVKKRQATYRELNEKSDRLTHHLEKKGVEADTLVGIMAKPSIEMIVGIVGILKAGGAYLPLEPEYPRERILYMLKESGTHILLSENPGEWKSLEGIDSIDLSTVLQSNRPASEPRTPRHYRPDQCCYIIYTSGTTGKPKGVMIEHWNVVRLMVNDRFQFDFNDRDVWTLFHSFCFDFSVWEMYGALLFGGRLVVLPRMTARNPRRYLEILAAQKVTVLNQTPSAFNNLLQEELKIQEKQLNLRYVIFGGEALKPAKLKEWQRKYPETKLVNMFGITETCVHVTYKEIGAVEIQEKSSNIGKPIPTLGTYVMDPGQRLMPPGAPGELYVGGDGVARGYLNRPELTALRFVDSSPSKVADNAPGDTPSIPYRVLYRTGDQAQLTSDGDLVYRGRLDHQVQLRGFRIELEEIENRLLEYPPVKEAVVLDRTDGASEVYLCAYIVSHHGTDANELTPRELREFIAGQLPDYMIPSYFVGLGKIPVTRNGKIDRSALPDPTDISLLEKTDYRPPTNDVEKKLVEIWETVLGRRNIGIDEDFFMNGGDSIKSIQIISRMSRAGYKVEMKDIFQYTVISTLAHHVKKAERYTDQAPVTGTITLTPIQKAFFEQSLENPHHFNQSVMFYVRDGLDKAAVETVFSKIQQHHDALRTTFKKDLETGDIIQQTHGLDYPLSLEEYDLRNRGNGPEELETKINEIQAGINLETGSLMKLGLFHLDDGDRLFITLHHLIIDGVSWRILFEDIETLFGQYKREEQPVLPFKTDSYKSWSEKLREYADSAPLLAEKEYWTQLAGETVPPIPTDFEVDGNDVKDNRGMSFTLEQEDVELLLTRVNKTFNTEINDILLTVFGMALRKSFGHDRVLIALEGHGREELMEDLDVSRTVGWFTSIYPVRMDVSYVTDPGRQIKEVKETLRQIPNKGIGYGILKHLTSPEHKTDTPLEIEPQVIFNYLGQFDADLQQISSFEIAAESTGQAQSMDNRRKYLLEVNGMTTDNRLTMTFSYNEKLFKSTTIITLVNHFQEELKKIIAFCTEKETTEPTPSDFTYKELSIDDIDRLMQEYPDIEDLYTLTPMQEGMMFHALYDDTSLSYFEQVSYRLQGDLDIALVEKSLNELFKRHDILRTAFKYKDIRRPVQVVLKNRTVDFYYEDIGNTHNFQDNREKNSFIEEFKEKDRARSFDLSKGVLMRVSILETALGEYEFIWSSHHILMDGWCFGILNREFFEIYNSSLENKPYRLPDIKPYRTYIQWFEKRDKKASAEYWANYLDSFGEQTGIRPTKIGETTTTGYKNETFSVVLDREKTARLNRLAARYQATLNTLAQAIWSILVGKHNDKKDVIFGAVVSGRPVELPGVESMVGLFINTIPVRITFSDHMKINTLLQNVQADALESEPHHFHPLAEIQSHSTLKQELIDHLFVFENYPISEHIKGSSDQVDKSGKRALKFIDVKVFEQSNYNLNVILSGSNRLKITFLYNANTYDPEYMQRIAGQFIHLFDQVGENEEQEVRQLSLLSEEEKNQILFAFNDTRREYSLYKTLHQLFEEQLERTPWNIALASPSTAMEQDIQVTYRQMNETADRWAAVLKALGIGPNTFVGVIMDRSVEMIVGVMAVVKSGGAYVPLEPTLPEARIIYCLASLNVTRVLTHSTYYDKITTMQPKLPDLKSVLNLDKKPGQKEIAAGNNVKSTVRAEDIAYIIFTSGTTGTPKGVVEQHRPVVNIIEWVNRTYRVGEADRLLFVASLSFDLSVYDIFGLLAAGGSLRVVPSCHIKTPDRLVDIIYKERITFWDSAPAALNLMTSYIQSRQETGDFLRLKSSMRLVFLSGDWIPVYMPNYLKEIFEGLQVIGLGGGTEATIWSNFYPIQYVNPDWRSIPYGKPTQNAKYYILDKHLIPCPIGLPGGLFIGGECLALGYMNDIDQTARKFIDNPFAPGERIYRTGDLARWFSDGNMEFLGRLDNQVKIRGFRIELGEIEYRLANHTDIENTVVLARKNKTGDAYLCAYMVAQRDIPAPELRTYLAAYLPEYMIPSYFVPLEKIPVSANGKIDHKALPDPTEMNVKDQDNYAPPVSIVEKKLVEAWESTLGRESIGIHDNFFMMGGDSIKSIQIISRMNSAGFKLELRDIFAYPQISQLAPHVKKKERTADQGPVTGPLPLTPFQRILFSQSLEERHHFNQSVMFYAAESFDKDAITAVFKRIQQHHDTLRITYAFDNQTNEIQQTISSPDVPISLREYDLRNRENALQELENRVNEIQAGIDLETGPLMKLGLFHLDDGERLLIVIHHLVIDTVSWRILLEDITSLYEQYKKGGPLDLPEKTDSYKHWAEKLAAYADSETFRKEIPYWAQIESLQVTPIKTNFPENRNDNDNYVKDTHSISFYLAEEETTRLLTEVNRAYNTEINDILLAALALTMKHNFSQDRLLLDLEGHGREEIFDDVDVSRTVGWFTSLFPVQLDISYTNDPSRIIKETKETLRRIPNKGIGYGILKYLTAEEHKKHIRFQLKPQVSFNFLGQFDADAGQMSSFGLAKESTGNNQGLRNQRAYLLEVSGIVSNNRLTMTINYNEKHFKQETMAALAGQLETQLKRIITHCRTKEDVEYTPSDYTYKELTIQGLDRLKETYPDLVDVYMLSPMQEGMLFHALADRDSLSYFEQMSYRMQGDLDMNLIQKSLQEMFKRHEILRTAFVYEDVQRPLQVVLKQRNGDFCYLDINGIGGKEEKENYITEFKAKDKQNPFDLSKDVLMRVAILQVNRWEYEFTWSFHHILMDGWCIGILNREFFEIYTALLEKRAHRLPPVKPYRTYIQWLEKKDREAVANYWENYLEAVERPTGIPKTKSRKKTGHETTYKNEHISVQLNEEKTAALNQLAARHHVTLNTVTQTVWGILLRKYTGEDNVVFGSVVSGRPSELDNVDSMVGLFINTIPVRLILEEKMKFHHLLQKVQEEAVACEPHHYQPLAEIQSRSRLKQDLIDHIFAFENFPVAAQLTDNDSQKENRDTFTLKLTNINVFEQTNYDLNVVLSGSDQLRITFQYNGNVYEKDFMERVGNHFLQAFNRVLADKEQEIGRIIAPSDEEKRQLLVDFNNTGSDYPEDKTIPQLFKEQVAGTPDAAAVIYYDMNMTYKTLSQEADKLATELRKQGVLRGTIVGLMVNRSHLMIVGILGILQAGGAYIPINPTCPEKRIINILADAGASILVTHSGTVQEYLFTKLQNLQSSRRNVHISEKRTNIKKLDKLPPPDRSLVDYHKYNRYIGQSLVKNNIAMLGTRGCPYNCAFCHKIWPKAHVAHSAEYIFQEVEFYYNMGVKRFTFLDDVFNLDQKNSRRFLEMVVESPMTIQLFLCLRGDILTPEYIDLMVEAGTIRMALALETASPRLQKLIGKNLNIEKFRQNVQYIVRKYPQVILEINTIHGFPTETEEEAMMTLEFLKSLKWIHFPYVHILKIYPNTEMEKLAMANGISRQTIQDFSDQAYHELPDTLPFSKAFTKQFQSSFFNEYFISRERLLHVLPYQMAVLTEDEIVQKYDSYLPVKIKTYDDLLEFVNISRQELRIKSCVAEETVAIPDLDEKLRRHFQPQLPVKKALKVLLLDLSQFFTHDSGNMLYDVVEPPLGLIYLMTVLNRQYPRTINGKIAKSRIDFDSYRELKALVTEFKPDVIGIRTLTFYRQFFHKTLTMLRQWGIHVPVIAGGPYATSDYPSILQDKNLDLVVLGEGETTFTEVIGKILNNNGKLPGKQALKEIPGLALIDEETTVGQTATRDIILLDALQQASAGEESIDREPINLPTDPAYVIFTSGSIGRPKSVMLEHRGVNNLVHSLYDRIYSRYNEHLNLGLISPYEFDASVKQIFTAITRGYRLHIVQDSHRLDGTKLLEFYRRHSIDISDGTPAHLRLLLESIDEETLFPPVKEFVIGGEELPAHLVEDFFEMWQGGDIKITNVYGPTECTDVTNCYTVSRETIPYSDTVPIGSPLNNIKTYILGINGELQPICTPGELHIAGVGLSRGYLNNPQLTAEKFVTRRITIENITAEDTTGSAIRLYKTGDRCCSLPDGNIHFLGRIDRQVKVRGFRVELGEIENRLANHPGIKETVVLVNEREDMAANLCAYFVEPAGAHTDEPLNTVQLRDFLSQDLPHYMIPSHFIKVDAFPLTSNAKIDRNALAKMGENLHTGTAYVPPETEVEKQIAAAFEEVLKLEKVSVMENFFELGGNSLTAITLTSRIKKAGFQVTLSNILANPVIKQLAEAISAKDETGASSEELQESRILVEQECIEKLNRGGNEHNLFIIHPLHGMVNQYKALAQELEEHYNVYGIQARGVKPGAQMAETPSEMIDDYVAQIKALQESGPYFISGYCAGNIIAYEIVKKLEQMNHKVEKLILFNIGTFFSGFSAAILRVLKHVPRSLKRVLFVSGDSRFKKAIRKGKLQKWDGGEERIVTGDAATRKEKIREYIHYISSYALTFETVKASILVPIAEESEPQRATEADFSIMTRSSVNVVKTPGNHETLFAKPHVEKMAEILKGILN